MQYRAQSTGSLTSTSLYVDFKRYTQDDVELIVWNRAFKLLVPSILLTLLEPLLLVGLWVVLLLITLVEG